MNQNQNQNKNLMITKNEFHCSPYIIRILDRISYLHSVLLYNVDEYPITDSDITVLQQVLLSGKYVFSNLRHVIYDPEQPHTIVIVPSTLNDEMVIGAMGDILIEEMIKTSFFHPSCYEFFTPSKNLNDYLNSFQEWSNIDMIYHYDCSKAISTINRKKLLEKVSHLVNHDESFMKLVTSYCHLPVVDEQKGKELVMENGIAPLAFMSDVLLNLMLSDIDKKSDFRIPST